MLRKLATLFCLLASISLHAQVRTPDAISGPNLPAQPIGPNDLIAISVYDAPEFTRTVRVSDDGAIRLPMLQRTIKADGLLPAALETAVAEALKAEELIVDPFVTVTVVEYYSRPISVGGAVRNPINFQSVGKVTLMDAINRAGGLTPDAGAEILVTTGQQGPNGPLTLTRRIPVKALIDAADPEVNLQLHGGEEIRVPEAGKIFVVGNVRKPGAYAIQDETETTVFKAIALSEGLAPYAAKQAYIMRRDDRTGAKNEIPIELNKIMKRKAPDVPLLASDILYIPDATGKRQTWTAVEKIIGFGGAAGAAVIYGTTR